MCPALGEAVEAEMSKLRIILLGLAILGLAAIADPGPRRTPHASGSNVAASARR